MSGKFLRIAAFCFPLILFSKVGLGGLIVDPLGTTLFNGSTGDELRVELELASGTGFHFFGQDVTRVFISENGHVGFSQNQPDFFPGPLGANSNGVFGSAKIAPLWDDYLLDPLLDNSVTARYVPNQYLQVTWSNVRLYNETFDGEPFPDTQRSVQMVWFDGDTTLRGFDFKKDDIAFGYIPHTNVGPEYFGAIDATAGLDNGNGTFSSVLGTLNGELNPADGRLLAWGENDFLLFRPGDESVVPDGFLPSNFQGGYYRGAFTLAAVPEPSTFLLLIVASGFPVIRMWKNSSRRKRAAHREKS